jgi:hypothetical protein
MGQLINSRNVMDVILNPLQDLLATIAKWLPSFVGALLILLIGYWIARAVEGLVIKLLRRAKFDGLLHRGTGGSYIERVVPSPSKTLGSVIFWLLWIGFLSLAVTVLGVPALTNFVFAIYSYVPNLVAALLIFLVAGAVSTASVALVNRVMGDTPTGKIVATVVPTITMLIAVFMILNQLQIAKDIVNITYAALVGSAALAMALAFGLGGRKVAADLLEQAVEAGRRNAGQAQSDVRRGADRAGRVVEDVKSREDLG